MQLVDDDLEVRHGVDGIVEVAGLWYARHGSVVIGPLESPDEVRAFLDLLDAVAAARGVPEPPSEAQP